MWQPLSAANVTASLGYASAPAYTNLFAFGDSLSDAGNLGRVREDSPGP